MRITLLTILAASCCFAFGGEGFRYYYSYADQELVNIARASGRDPSATIGKEIPAERPLTVPVFGVSFKVRLNLIVEGITASAYIRDTEYMLTFDRATWSSTGWEPPPSSYQYRKVEPARKAFNSVWQVNDYATSMSNYGYADGWENRNTMFDRDGDGQPDLAQYRQTYPDPVSVVSGSSGPGISSRPIGLRGGVGLNLVPNSFSAGTYIQKNVAHEMFDVEFRSLLSPGETYGYGSGETGLGIHTAEILGDSGQAGATWTTPVLLPQYRTFTGANYKLIGFVPEPNGLLAFGAGILLLRRRRSGC